MNELEALIRDEIAEKGPISFLRFMELALYHPVHGYYEQLATTQIGQRGDFYTSVSVGPLFGELLAYQFVEWNSQLTGEHQIIEAGSHNGQLARDILTWFRQFRPSLMGQIKYLIIEPSLRRRAQQETMLEEFKGCVQWIESWDALDEKSVSGIIFSNELLDAFPLRRLGWDAQRKTWFEWGVDWVNGRFDWVKFESRENGLEFDAAGCFQHLARELLDVLPDGFTTELNPHATAWWQRAATALCCGKLLAVDYGLLEEQFFVPERAHGTLRAYSKHHVNHNVLSAVGAQDLTAQVNFTAIQRAGESVGLSTEFMGSQAQFLTKVVESTMRPNAGFGKWTPERLRQLKTLTHPEHLGRSFKVLVQSRDNL